jgi:AcrR family transcriptional regulator
MIELASERPIGAITVEELVGLAGVSKPTFYRHFEGKDDCLLSTYERVMRTVAERIDAVQRPRNDSRQRLRAGFRAFAEEVVAEPKAARFALVGAFAAGPAGLARMERSVAPLEAALERALVGPDDGEELPPLLAKVMVAGAARVIRGRLLAGREAELPDLADGLVAWALSCRCAEPERLAEWSRGPAGGGGCGPSALETVKPSSEYESILQATIDLAVADGYWRLSVPRIRARAGVSRQSFDAHFSGVADCFFSALGLYVGAALHQARADYEAAESWEVGIRRASRVLCRAAVRNRDLARLSFVEIYTLGAAGVRWRARMLDRIVEVLVDGSRADRRLGRLEAEASVGASWALVQQRIVADDGGSVPALADPMTFLFLAPALGGDPAIEWISAMRAALPARRLLPRQKAA